MVEIQCKSCKVVLLGESGVGKTSIINKLMENEFNSTQLSTTGATFSTKTFYFDEYKKSVCFEIWDTAGQEKFRSLTKMFYKDAAVAILVYDITRKETFDELQNYWVVEVQENSPKRVILGIAGNKSDLYEIEQVDINEVKEYSKEVGAIFKLTSCKNQFGVDELFKEIGCKFLDPNNQNSPKEIEEETRIKKGSMKIIPQKNLESHINRNDNENDNDKNDNDNDNDNENLNENTENGGNNSRNKGCC